MEFILQRKELHFAYCTLMTAAVYANYQAVLLYNPPDADDPRSLRSLQQYSRFLLNPPDRSVPFPVPLLVFFTTTQPHPPIFAQDEDSQHASHIFFQKTKYDTISEYNTITAPQDQALPMFYDPSTCQLEMYPDIRKYLRLPSVLVFSRSNGSTFSTHLREWRAIMYQNVGNWIDFITYKQTKAPGWTLEMQFMSGRLKMIIVRDPAVIENKEYTYGVRVDSFWTGMSTFSSVVEYSVLYGNYGYYNGWEDYEFTEIHPFYHPSVMDQKIMDQPEETYVYE